MTAPSRLREVAEKIGTDPKTLRAFLRVVRLRSAGVRWALRVHRQGRADDEGALHQLAGRA